MLRGRKSLQSIPLRWKNSPSRIERILLFDDDGMIRLPLLTSEQRIPSIADAACHGLLLQNALELIGLRLKDVKIVSETCARLLAILAQRFGFL
jgi:hypothetical protein